MSSFDIKQMARELVARGTLPSAREVIVLRFVETAVDMINSPWQSNALLGALSSAYELDYDLINVEQQVLDIVNTIRTDMHKNRWDRRIKIKMDSRTVGRNFHRINILMDLDATLAEALEEDSNYRKSMEVQASVSDVVIDNPDMDTINELDRVLLGESTPRPKVLSDRLGKFVRDDTRGGLTMCDWKATDRH